MYVSVIRTVMYDYVCDTCTLNKSEENALEIRERKILRNICGRIRTEPMFKMVGPHSKNGKKQSSCWKEEKATFKAMIM